MPILMALHCRNSGLQGFCTRLERLKFCSWSLHFFDLFHRCRPDPGRRKKTVPRVRYGVRIRTGPGTLLNPSGSLIQKLSFRPKNSKGLDLVAGKGTEHPQNVFDFFQYLRTRFFLLYEIAWFCAQ